MKRLRSAFVHAVLFAAMLGIGAPVWADGWRLRDRDQRLTPQELIDLTSGQTLRFYDDGQSTYSVGGSYSYTYAGGRTAFGQFDLAADGSVCVTFRNGIGRCDLFVHNGERLVLITQKGERFPVR